MDDGLPAGVTTPIRRGWRRKRLLAGSVGAVWGLAFGAYLLDFAPLWVAAVAVVTMAGWFVPVFEPAESFRLRTERSPETVREQLRSVESPLVLGARVLADDDGIEVARNGVTFSVTQYGGLVGSEIRYWTDEREDGTVEIEVTRGDTDPVLVTARPQSDGDGGTRLAVEIAESRRFSLREYAMTAVESDCQETALDAYGYEFEDGETIWFGV